MENKKLISIIVPVYNAEKYIAKCIESIINQTYKNLELILVNDGSSDESGAICDEYASKDVRIKVLHKANAGVSAARNTGLELANGDFIGFVDSDDYISLDMYASMIRKLEDSNCDFIQCRYSNVSKDKSVPYKFTVDDASIFCGEQAIRLLFEGPITWTSVNKVYKKDVIGETRFPEDLSMCEDFLFLYWILDKGAKIVTYNDVYYYYYDNPTSQTKVGLNLKGSLEANEKIIPSIHIKYPSLMPNMYRTMTLQFISTWESAELAYNDNTSYIDIRNDLCRWARKGIIKYCRALFLNPICEKKYKIKMLFIVVCPAIYKLVLPKYKKMIENK